MVSHYVNATIYRNPKITPKIFEVVLRKTGVYVVGERSHDRLAMRDRIIKMWHES